ncbi:MAG: PIN domain-containing protein [Prevotella sp.]|nr:PIN domain-containing protein [Prevotella sp.]
MMRVFLDTNILLDIIEGRQKFLIASSNVFDLGIRGEIQMFATPLTFANCVYTARKNVGYERALQGLKFLKNYVKAAAMDDAQVEDALCSGMPDFEDMLQYEAALASKCDVIVTRDKKRHFPKDGDIPVLTPEAFLNEFFNE